MPIFTHEPPELPDGYVFRILRTPANKPLRAIITCTDPVGTMTHFANNRTIPCEGPDNCPLCADGYSRRWHGYVSCITCGNLEHILFEFTAHASDTFKNYYQLHTTLRACLFTAFRPSKRNNGRVVIHTSPADEQRIQLPEPPNIQRLLCHIWNVRYTNEQLPGMARPPFKMVDLPDPGQDGRYSSPAKSQA